VFKLKLLVSFLKDCKFWTWRSPRPLTSAPHGKGYWPSKWSWIALLMGDNYCIFTKKGIKPFSLCFSYMGCCSKLLGILFMWKRINKIKKWLLSMLDYLL